MGPMKFSLDAKPIGAFIEYTVKPLIDYSHELLDLMEKHGLRLSDSVKYACKIYIADMVVRSLTQIACTGLVCYTAWLCLSTAK